MTNKLNNEASKVGLKIHTGKTQWMSNAHTNATLKLGDDDLVRCNEYKYLGQIITLDGDLCKEINNRIKCSWLAFRKIENLLKSKEVTQDVKADLFNSNILPTLLYASETWNTTLSNEIKLRTTQRTMERRMCNISKLQHIRAEEIRNITKVKDVNEEMYRSKKRWAGHVARTNDGRWTQRATTWYPRDAKRSRGRPKMRWMDHKEVRCHLGKSCT